MGHSQHDYIGEKDADHVTSWTELNQMQKSTLCEMIIPKSFLSTGQGVELNRPSHWWVLTDLCTILRPKVDITELESLRVQFASLAQTEGDFYGIPRAGFNRCLGPIGYKENIVLDRLFDVR